MFPSIYVTQGKLVTYSLEVSAFVRWVAQRQKNPGCEDALHPGKFLRVRKVFARIYKIDP